MTTTITAMNKATTPPAYRTKHIDIRYHYIREALRDGVVDLRFCPTSEMLADLLTKVLSKNTFVRLRLSVGMEQIKRLSIKWECY